MTKSTRGPVCAATGARHHGQAPRKLRQGVGALSLRWLRCSVDAIASTNSSYSVALADLISATDHCSYWAPFLLAHCFVELLTTSTVTSRCLMDAAFAAIFEARGIALETLRRLFIAPSGPNLLDSLHYWLASGSIALRLSAVDS